MNNFNRYHEQIANEVLRELHSIQTNNKLIQQFERDFSRMANIVDEEEDDRISHGSFGER